MSVKKSLALLESFETPRVNDSLLRNALVCEIFQLELGTACKKIPQKIRKG